MLEQDFNGHFWGNAIINNKKLPIMIDTGASTIAISKKDAKKLGISTKNLSFFQTAITAGGIIKYDIVTLKKFSFEGIEFKNIDIAILDNQTVMPLLGMNFLERLSKFEFKGSKVILHK
jgi:aspartyl protease family protein